MLNDIKFYVGRPDRIGEKDAVRDDRRAVVAHAQAKGLVVRRGQFDLRAADVQEDAVIGLRRLIGGPGVGRRDGNRTQKLNFGRRFNTIEAYLLR